MVSVSAAGLTPFSVGTAAAAGKSGAAGRRECGSRLSGRLISRVIFWKIYSTWVRKLDPFGTELMERSPNIFIIFRLGPKSNVLTRIGGIKSERANLIGV